MTPPKIGEPRVYPPGPVPILYPGEQATAQFDLSPEQLAERGGVLTERDVTGWLVEPAPGWRAAYLRWRWRLLGRFVKDRS